MKIGVCLNLNSMEEFEKQIEKLAKEGFETCQIISWKPEIWTDENVSNVSDLLGKYNVTPSAFWCGWEGPAVWDFYEGPLTLGLLPREYRQMRVKNLCDGADFAKKLGITDVVTHMGFIPENPNDSEFAPFCDAVRTVAEHLEKNEQYLLFETGQETPTAMLRCFETVGTKNLGVNLDTANLILYGKANPVDALDIIGKYVRNLHAKDGFYPTNGSELGKEVPLGEGKVDFVAVVEKLHSLSFDSHITIENECSGDDVVEIIRKSKKFLEDIIEKVVSK